MKLDDQQINTIAWLVEGIKLHSNDYDNNLNDMETCLMKIAAYSHAIDVIMKDKT